MSADSLYSACVTSVPLLLVAAVAAGSPSVFGPTTRSSSRRERRLDITADVLVLVALLVAFVVSLVGLAVVDPPDFRLPAALGLGVAGVVVLAQVSIVVARLYRAGPPAPAST